MKGLQRVTVYLDPDDVKVLDKIAEQTEISRTKLINEILLAHLGNKAAGNFLDYVKSRVSEPVENAVLGVEEE